MSAILNFNFKNLYWDCVFKHNYFHTFNVITFTPFHTEKEIRKWKMREIFKIQIMVSVKIILWSLVKFVRAIYVDHLLLSMIILISCYQCFNCSNVVFWTAVWQRFSFWNRPYRMNLKNYFLNIFNCSVLLF